MYYDQNIIKISFSYLPLIMWKVLFLYYQVNDDLGARLATGTLRVKPDIVRFTTDSAVFTDGSEVKLDAVVFATG